MSRRLQTYETEAVTVTFEPARCIHAAECVRGLPAVFDPRRKRWIRPELGPPELVAEVVERCPTGALRAALHDAAAHAREEADAVTISIQRDGPLYLRGPVRLVGEDGAEMLVDGRVAICRCGATANAPFCDGSHLRVRFRAPADR